MSRGIWPRERERARGRKREGSVKQQRCRDTHIAEGGGRQSEGTGDEMDRGMQGEE